jgi:hypothetical protein
MISHLSDADFERIAEPVRLTLLKRLSSAGGQAFAMLCLGALAADGKLPHLLYDQSEGEHR